MTGIKFGEIFQWYIFPFLPPITTVAALVVQQLYYPSAKPTMIINILLLAMNFLEFIPLFLSRSTNRILHLTGTSLIAILAFLFNIRVGGVSTPLSDFKAFLDSVCGLWILVLALEAVFLRFLLVPSDTHAEPPPPGTDPGGAAGAGGTASTGSIEPGSGGPAHTDSSDGAAGKNPSPGPCGPFSSQSHSPFSPRHQNTKFKASLFLVFFAAAAVLLPFADWGSFAQSGWMSSAYAITQLIFGNGISTEYPAVILLLYLLGLFAIAIFLIVVVIGTQYVLSRYLEHTPSQKNFFEEYSTPIIILVITGALILAIRSNAGTESAEEGLPVWPLILNYATSLFAYMLIIILAIIILLVAVETIRLILNQCMKRGSLLKGSMHMIFTLVVDYTMGLLMGTLRIFALKDVIESLLLFFLPDLNQSVEPDIKRVLDAALKREIRQVEKDMELEPPAQRRQRPRRSKHRIIQKRRRRK